MRPKRFARTLSVDRALAATALPRPLAGHNITPKIDLSHISKPGDVLKAILANKQKEEQGRQAEPVAGSRQGCAGRSTRGARPPVAAPAAPPVTYCLRRIPAVLSRAKLFPSRGLRRPL